MKKSILTAISVLLIGTIVAFFYAYQHGVLQTIIPDLQLPNLISSGKTAWKYEKTIAQPLTAQNTASQETVLGDLETYKITIQVAKGAFDTDTTVSLSTPDSVPEIEGTIIDPIGAPIELSIGQPTRLNEKATVTFALDKDKLPPETQAYQIRIAYFNGTQWDYIKPTFVDMDKGLISFEMYHFSLMGATKVKDDTKVTEQWIHSQSLDNKLKEGMNDVTDEIAGKVVDMILGKMGISDESVKGKVLGELLKDDSYKEIYDAYKAGDSEGFSQKIAVLAGSKIAENVPDSILKDALGSLAEGAEDLEAVSKALGSIAGGQYQDAARIIGVQIADKFLITTAAKIAVEVIDGQIQSWKNSEIEAAYIAFRDGSNAHFYGYNVDKGDFNEIWDQMRGIRRQLELEAINKENELREDAGMPLLSDKQMDSIRNSVKQAFQTQFTTRQNQEEEIAKEEAKLKAIMDAFKKANFLGILPPKDLDKGYDLEQKLDILHHFAKKMMRDTGRDDITDKTGLLVDGKISLDDLVQGARMYFNGEEGKKDYQKFLLDRFGIQPYPKLTDLTGSWKGSMTITDVIIPENISNEVKDDLKKEGCEDLNFDDIRLDLKDAIGKQQDFSITISPTSETGGTLTSGGGDDSRQMPFTYTDGVIKATMSEKGGTGIITLTPNKDKDTYSLSGSLILNFKDLFKITASLSLRRG